MSENTLNICGRFNRKVFLNNEQMLGVENMQRGIEERGKHIWELPFHSNPYTEDNESCSDEDDDDEANQQGHALEFFLEQEEELLWEKKKMQ